MGADVEPLDVRAEVTIRPVLRVVDVDGVTHGWDRYRTGPDESEDITWCNQWLHDDWVKLESKKPIDCMACLGSEEARYHGESDA